MASDLGDFSLEYIHGTTVGEEISDSLALSLARNRCLVCRSRRALLRRGRRLRGGLGSTLNGLSIGRCSTLGSMVVSRGACTRTTGRLGVDVGALGACLGETFGGLGGSSLLVLLIFLSPVSHFCSSL